MSADDVKSEDESSGEVLGVEITRQHVAFLRLAKKWDVENRSTVISFSGFLQAQPRNYAINS